MRNFTRLYFTPVTLVTVFDIGVWPQGSYGVWVNVGMTFGILPSRQVLANYVSIDADLHFL
jgi:hypothetical protein